MPALSVIIPIYNKERYVDDCINSVLSQTFTDFELILVDDGSTDNSGAVCDAYLAKDERIKVIHQVNAGVSAARNTGLNVAKGTYIGFIDSDDTIEPDMYELLVKNAEAHEADISVCRMRVVFPNKVVAPPESKEVMTLNHQQALSACLKGDLDRSANNKIYRAAIARQFEFEGQMYEDILYTCKVFLTAKQTVVQHKVKYNYLVRSNSTSMSAFSLKYMQTVKVSAEMVKLVGEHTPACLPEAKAFDIVANISLLNLLLLAGKEKFSQPYQQVTNTLHQYKQFIGQTHAVERKHKYAYKAFSLFPGLYTWLMYAYCRLTGAEVIKRTQQIAAT